MEKWIAHAIAPAETIFVAQLYPILTGAACLLSRDEDGVMTQVIKFNFSVLVLETFFKTIIQKLFLCIKSFFVLYSKKWNVISSYV